MTKQKFTLKPDAKLNVFSCRICNAVLLSELTFLEFELRFFKEQRESWSITKEVGCPICGASMDQIVRRIVSKDEEVKRLENAKRMIMVAARVIRQGLLGEGMRGV
jgi:hypothetical protein